MKYSIKAIQRIVGIITLLKYKLIYGKRFSFKFSDRVSASFRVRIAGESYLSLGHNVSIRDNVIFNITNGMVCVENNVFFNDFVCVNSRDSFIKIGEGTVIGQSAKFYDHDHDYKKNMQHDFISSPVEIGENVWIGSDVIILRGSVVNSNSVVGAGTLLKGEVKENTVYFNEKKPIIRR